MPMKHAKAVITCLVMGHAGDPLPRVVDSVFAHQVKLAILRKGTTLRYINTNDMQTAVVGSTSKAVQPL
jgi:hypothetical protein